MHAGIQGGDDLNPAIHGWTDPVATISITRLTKSEKSAKSDQSKKSNKN
jgi:hypothetical protein